ncbi:hypothetical protein [Thalassorhabdomicrobium marinisediminis]|uniref:hypothetical protein n=1 Tax=Thalassorhabdomicrobium marinisediminis TaxID=2170577 RepID=UPI002493C16A|nr:hypothetical protein [Thalassorhabdomicrobium marinisediminis]
MKHILPLILALSTAAGAAQAECYADYKAKRDDPLRLHYGVAEILDVCSEQAAAAELEPRLAKDDWQLLSIEGVFDATGLEEREESAGEFYLRY